jgi:hypothetical protein
LALAAAILYPTDYPTKGGEPMRTRIEILTELRAMLRDVFVAKSTGGTYARLARAHGYVDGYMRALLDAGTVSKEELLEIVGTERENVSGPATRVLDPEQLANGEVAA